MRSQEVFTTPRKLSQSAKSKIGADYTVPRRGCQGLFAYMGKLGQPRSGCGRRREIRENFGRFGKIKLDIF